MAKTPSTRSQPKKANPLTIAFAQAAKYKKLHAEAQDKLDLLNAYLALGEKYPELLTRLSRLSNNNWHCWISTVATHSGHDCENPDFFKAINGAMKKLRDTEHASANPNDLPF